MRERALTGDSVVVSDVVSWTFGVVFAVIGVLNAILVHPVPGIFYLLLSTVYPPPVNTIIKKRFGFTIPLTVKIILGFLVLWGTLAVTDLAEMAGL